jgi:hypothetical protein
MKGKKEGNLLTVLLRLSPATLDKQWLKYVIYR